MYMYIYIHIERWGRDQEGDHDRRDFSQAEITSCVGSNFLFEVVSGEEKEKSSAEANTANIKALEEHLKVALNTSIAVGCMTRTYLTVHSMYCLELAFEAFLLSVFWQHLRTYKMICFRAF